MFSWLLVLLCKTGELLFAKIKLTFEFMMLPQVKWCSQQSKSPLPSALEIQKKKKVTKQWATWSQILAETRFMVLGKMINFLFER